VPAAGGEAISMTAEGESSWRPRWSPDGRYLAFLSARGEGKTQVWTLRRQGGEAEQLTDTPQSVGAFEWSPDSSRLALVLQDLKPEHRAAIEAGEEFEDDKPGPWVIDREFFKTDYVGYLDRRRRHIYVFDVADRELAQLTGGDYDDASPAWSPDGMKIAFVSNRTDDADLNYNTDIWLVSSAPAEGGMGPLTQVTTNPGVDDSPAWSPDGQSITHTSTNPAQSPIYAMVNVAVSDAGGGGLRILTADLDRMNFPVGHRMGTRLRSGRHEMVAAISL